MILLDANILLEALIEGREHKEEVLKWMLQNNDEWCINMLTVHLVLYFGLKDGLTVNHLKEFLADYPKVSLMPEDYASAIAVIRDKDHEDALQLATAERVGCSHIVTLDPKFAST